MVRYVWNGRLEQGRISLLAQFSWTNAIVRRGRSGSCEIDELAEALTPGFLDIRKKV